MFSEGDTVYWMGREGKIIMIDDIHPIILVDFGIVYGKEYLKPGDLSHCPDS